MDSSLRWNDERASIAALDARRLTPDAFVLSCFRDPEPARLVECRG
jgi:hypothetical protein